jgi:hypothetical protein
MADDQSTNVPVRSISTETKSKVLDAVRQALELNPSYAALAPGQIKPFTGLRTSAAVIYALDALVDEGKLKKSRWKDNSRVSAYSPSEG